MWPLRRFPPTQWEHGWKTENVTATRYRNPAIAGITIGFRFPRNPYDCDRSDLIEFIEKTGDGVTMECGGYPSAEVVVKFRGIDDKAAADKWLPDFLPKLSQFVAENLK